MRAALCVVAATAGLQLCGGCAAVVNAIGEEPVPFGGVRLEVEWLRDDLGFFPRFLWALDLPATLALDAALLPFATTDWLLRLATGTVGRDPEPASRSEPPEEAEAPPQREPTGFEEQQQRPRDGPLPEQRLGETPSFSRSRPRGALAE